MQIPRDRFIEHFSCSILVHCLRHWSRATKRFPDHLSTSIYDTMKMCAGEIPIGPQAFKAIVEPVIRELHARTPFRSRPEPATLAGLVYDALDGAGVEVTIGPPAKTYGHMYGARPGNDR